MKSQGSLTPDAPGKQGRGLCQGVSARARARESIEGRLLKDFRQSVNFGAGFTGP
jgi:hypothetical protein